MPETPDDIVAAHQASIDELLARALCLMMLENPDAVASRDLKPRWEMKLQNPHAKIRIALARDILANGVREVTP